MSQKCIECGSYAINHHCHGRDGSDGELCDVCYWRKRADELDKPTMLVIQENKDLKHRCDELLAALEGLLADMRLRARLEGDVDSDGCVVINCGNGVLYAANAAISKAKGV